MEKVGLELILNGQRVYVSGMSTGAIILTGSQRVPREVLPLPFNGKVLLVRVAVSARQKGWRQGGGGGPTAGGNGDAVEMNRRAFANGRAGLCNPALSAAKGNMTISRLL